MPAVTRVGDADVAHCSGMTRAEGSPDVTVNGRPVSRAGDDNTAHLLPPNLPPCPSHAAPIATGSRTVTVNGRGIGRVGDAISGCTRVAEGSPDVTAGPAGVPPGQPDPPAVRPVVAALAVSWAEVPRATGYKVQWKSGAQSFDASRQASVTGTMYTITGLAGGTRYDVRVIPTLLGAADGPASAPVAGTPWVEAVTLSAPGSTYAGSPGFLVQWIAASGLGRLPQAWFTSTTADTRLFQLALLSSGAVVLDIGFNVRSDLSASVRASLALVVTTAHGSVTVVGVGGAGDAEPYEWTPANAAEVRAFVAAHAGRTIAAELTFARTA